MTEHKIPGKQVVDLIRQHLGLPPDTAVTVHVGGTAPVHHEVGYHGLVATYKTPTKGTSND